MSTPYDAVGGLPVLLRLAEAWHRRVLVDDVVGHAFSHGFADDHLERLAAYLGEALGGGPLYSGQYGDESSVVRMHSGNGEHDDMDQRGIACFVAAVDEIGVSMPDPLRELLIDYFTWATRVGLGGFPNSADDVPDGLTIPQWRWDGLAR